MNCPKCRKPLAELLIHEIDSNVINKSLASVAFCVDCQQLYELIPKKIVLEKLEV
jgi:uncharacterized protein with PIN domain